MVGNGCYSRENNLYLVSLVYYRLKVSCGPYTDNNEVPAYFLDKDLVDSFYSLSLEMSKEIGTDLEGRFKFKYNKFAYDYNSLKDIDKLDEDKKDDLLNTEKPCVLFFKFKENRPLENLLFGDFDSAIKFVNTILYVYNNPIDTYSSLFKTYKEYVDYVRYCSMYGSSKALSKLNRLVNSEYAYDTDIDKPTWITINSHYDKGLLGRIFIRKVNLNTVDSVNANSTVGGSNPYRSVFEDNSETKSEVPVMEYVRYTPKKFIGVSPKYSTIV